MNDTKKFTDSNFDTNILENDNNPSLYRRFPSILLIIFILLSTGICYLGFLYYLNFKEKITENAENELHSVGVMKVNEILSWKEELLEDAENISKNPLIINDLVYYFNNKNKFSPNNTKQINYWLESLTKLYKFNSAILFDTSGNNCLSYPLNINKDSYEDNIILRNSLNQRKINFSDIHFPDSDSNRLAFDLFIPILVVNEKDTVSAGVVTLEIDPRIYLFPTIQKWPSPSNTAEALLIEKSGNDVVFLNDLRHIGNSALRLKIPLTNDNLPATQVLKGKTGLTEGIDYRGVEVFASLHQLPGTPWSLVTKIDKDEVFSGLAKRALWIAGYALLLIILSGSAIAFYWRQQKFTFFRKQYELELEKQALTRHYNYMFRYANDIIILTDDKWNILEVNDKAISVYGYTKEELLKLKLVDLRVNKSEELFNTLVEGTDESGGKVIESEHSKKDGTIIKIENSIRPFAIEGKKYYQSIIRDITVWTEDKKKIQESEEELRALFNSMNDVIFVMDRDNKYVKIAPTNPTLLYKPFEELIGKTLYEVFPQKTAAFFENAVKKVFETKSPNNIEYSIPIGEDLMWFNAVLTPMGEDKVITVARDITPKKNDEKKILQLNRVYSVLSDVNKAIVRIKNKQKLFEEACRLVVEDGRFDLAWIANVNSKNRNIEIASSYGNDLSHLNHLKEFFDNKSLTNDHNLKKYFDGNNVIYNDLKNDKLISNIPFGKELINSSFNSTASFPLVVFGKTIGALFLFSKELNVFSSDEISLINELASDISFALEYIQQEEMRLIADKSLAESEERFRMLYEQAPLSYQSLNSTGYFLDVNTQWLKMFGYRKGEVLGRNFAEFLSPQSIKYFYDKFGEFLDKGEIADVEFEMMKKDGTLINVILFGKVGFDSKGNIKQAHCILNDVTESKLAEQQIRMLSSGIKHSPVSIVITDLDGIVEYVNPKFTETTGYILEEIIGKNIKILRPDFVSEQEDEDLWTILKAKNEWTGEIISKRKNGEIFWEFASISPIKNEYGITTHLLAVKEDITKRKKVEEDLRIAKEKAEEASSIKSNFLAIMSHELRTPMTGILGFADMLYSELKQPDLKEMAELILKGGKRLTDTLNSILDLSSVEANKIETSFKVINVNSIITETVKLFDVVAKDKNLIMRIESETNDINAPLDDRLFSQILNNLLNNAIKYTDEGEVVITITSGIKQGKNYVVIKVKDTGIGISKENCSLIFEPFRQVSEGLSRKYEGTGLGLTITKKFVEIMNGYITVDSISGVGSTFTISFPISSMREKKLSSVNNMQGMRPDPLKIPNILHVEDDVLGRKVVRVLLKGYANIKEATDGEIAVKLAEEFPYDIILMDINLRGISGLEAAKQIRQLSGYSNVPIVAVTAYAMVGDKEKFLDGNCTHYLSKPFTREDLLNVITKALNIGLNP